MDGGSWHRMGGKDQDHLQGKKKNLQKGQMVVWGDFKIAEKKKEKKKAKEKKKDIPIWMQNLKE